MKKFALLSLAIILFTTTALFGCKESSNGLAKVRLNEVAHSIFYAPLYVALNNGYFEEEGLEISLVNAGGADKVMAALLSGDADIGFSGSEATIYVYNGGEKDYLKTFNKKGVNNCELLIIWEF